MLWKPYFKCIPDNRKGLQFLGFFLCPFCPVQLLPCCNCWCHSLQDSEGGLYVCMNTFLGFGREHIERHYRKTGQCVYLHLKRHLVEVRLVASQRTVLVSVVLIWVMHFRHRPSPEWLKCTRSYLGLDVKSRCLDPSQSYSFSFEVNQKP